MDISRSRISRTDSCAGLCWRSNDAVLFVVMMLNIDIEVLKVIYMRYLPFG